MAVSKGTLPRSDHRAKRPSKKGSDVAARQQRNIDTSTFSGRVALRLRDLREENGWSMAELLEKLNTRLRANGTPEVAAKTLYAWDNGTRKIDPDYYPLFAKLFKLSIADFLPKA